METPRAELLVSTDAQSRLVLSGHPNQRYLKRETSDGVIVLEPAVVVSVAQHQYDTNPDLRAVLAEAKAAPTVTHRFSRERDDSSR